VSACHGRVIRIVPAKVDARTAARFDVNDDWSLIQSTGVLVGSYPIEIAGARKFAWVGPTARIAFPFSGSERSLNISGWIPFHQPRVRNGVKELVVEVLAGGRKLADMRFDDEDVFERSLSLKGISGDQDGNLVVELKCSSSLGSTQSERRRLSFVVNTIWLERRDNVASYCIPIPASLK
jgi:hypothetical protein